MEASQKMTRRLMLAMAVLLVIVAGLNRYALWPSDMTGRRLIIIEEELPAPEPAKVVRGEQA